MFRILHPALAAQLVILVARTASRGGSAAPIAFVLVLIILVTSAPAISARGEAAIAVMIPPQPVVVLGVSYAPAAVIALMA